MTLYVKKINGRPIRAVVTPPMTGVTSDSIVVKTDSTAVTSDSL